MIRLEEKRNELLKMYYDWADQLDNSFLSDNYSNPYYIAIPDDWFDNKKTRIMIVGEEGAGAWGCGKSVWKGFNDERWNFKEDIPLIQDFNRKKTDYQLNIISEAKGYKKNNGKFWNRIRNIKSIGDNNVIIWNNLDKIHRIGNGHSCALTSNERDNLHKTTIKVLAEEIKILEPMIVIFCGWSNRKNAFSSELSGDLAPVYNKFFKKINGQYGCEQFKNQDKSYGIYYTDNNRTTYILTKHPQWQTTDYENNVIEATRNAIYHLLRSK